MISFIFPSNGAFHRFIVFQNSPEVDEEGYSIRPEDEADQANILKQCFFFVDE